MGNQFSFHGIDENLAAIDWGAIRESKRRVFTNNDVAPDELFQLAARSPEVRAAIDHWRGGRCAWETALILAIFNQARVIDGLRANATVPLPGGGKVCTCGAPLGAAHDESCAVMVRHYEDWRDSILDGLRRAVDPLDEARQLAASELAAIVCAACGHRWQATGEAEACPECRFEGIAAVMCDAGHQALVALGAELPASCQLCKEP